MVGVRRLRALSAVSIAAVFSAGVMSVASAQQVSKGVVVAGPLIPKVAVATDDRFLARVHHAERISIRIPGYAALSGEFRINGEGAISLPGIGRIDAGELTIAEFEDQLSREVARISNREVSVAIEVLEFRSIFVSGAISRPGAFAWKPGMSVIHAEALAGGLFRGTVMTGDSGSITTMSSGSDRERERAVRSAYDLAASMALMARLQMEKASVSTYVLPPRVAGLIPKADLDSLFRAQQATLQSRNLAFESKVAAAENAKVMAIQEKKALDGQQARLQDQLSKRRLSMRRVELMTKQGYTRGDRLFDEQVRVAELEERQTNVTLAMSRADVAAAAAQQQLDALILGRKAEIDTEMVALEQRIGQLEIEVESASGNYQRATGQDPISTRSGASLLPSYEIVRPTSGKSIVIPVDRSTQLQPNDVLIVGFGRRASN